MSRAIEIIDPEGEKRYIWRRRIVLVSCLLSLSIFGYPLGKDYYPKWRTLAAGRKLALYLSMLKTRAILNKTPLEARFTKPDSIEVYEVSSCGPNSQRIKLWDAKLSDFERETEFVSEPWLRENTGSKEPFLPRYCYDPVYGSSVFADGLAHGGIFLIHHSDLETHRGEHLVQLTVEGAQGDVEIE